MIRARTWLLAALVFASAGAPAQTADEAHGALERPIIAGVVAEPERYLGRRLELYGLVVQVKAGGKRFYIQDVSQRPLLVVAPQGKSAGLHQQYIVTGTVRRIDGELGIAAEQLTPTRVTAGGGCC
jgi:hypothetical protein